MIKNFKKNKVYNIYKLILFLLFSSVFLPQVFILNDDTNLISSYEVDPASLIVSINSLFNSPYYNMFNGHHTTYYGWTYASLTFLFLFPFKLIFFFFKIDSSFFSILLIRFAFYLIGLFSVFTLFRLCRKVLGTKNLIINFLLVILFIFSPFYNLFYFLHPETTGILFTFLAVIYLFDYEKKSKKRFYYYSFICFVLAALSKQHFFITSFFLLIFLFFLFCKKNKIILLTYVFFKEIIKSFLLSLFIFFLVHPYAFLKPFKFFYSQIFIGTEMTKNTNLNFFDTFILWVNLYKSSPFFLFSMILNILNIIIIIQKKNSNVEKIFNFTLFLIIVSTIFYFSFGNKTNINFYHYEAIYPIIILQLLLFLKTILDLSFFNKIQFKILLVFLLLIFPIYNFGPTIKSLQQRFLYKEGISYKSYEYFKENLTFNDKIANDHTVAIPFYMKDISCHYWQGCNTYNQILNFQPNYVAFSDPLPVWSWSENLEGKALKKYAEDKKMKLVKIIDDKNSNSKILIFKLDSF